MDHSRVKSRKRPNGLSHKRAGLNLLLTQAIDNSSDLIALGSPEATFAFANRALLKTLGYSRREIIGQPFALVMSNNPKALLEEFGAKILQPAGWNGECLITRRNGENLFVSMNVGPIRDDKGELVGTFGIAQDISVRKQADQKLRQSEEQFRDLAEHIREVFFIFTPEPARIAYISPAYDEIWGRPRQQLYEQPAAWMESIHPDDRESVGTFYGQSNEGIPSEMAYRVIRPDGSFRWIDARTFPVRDSQGKLSRIVGIAEDITVRRETNERLNVALAEAEEQARETAKLTELLDTLQCCQTIEEAYKITSGILPAALPSRAGAVCITSSSRNVVEAVATWGDALATERTFGPDDCWALRRGKVHQVYDPKSALHCVHVTGSPADGYLCVPLAAQGETLGVLYLEVPARSEAPSTEARPVPMDILFRRATIVGDRISLALANLRLREALRRQSIRDPLTGLFNRRYMEESLERELSRAVRNDQPVAVLMLDIDHFKRFNDTFGHQAGDKLLRALGDFLMQRTRGQDVACRYGGEEFALIMANAAADAARKRADLLREELKELTVEYGGQTLGRVTVSIGIAVFPSNADNAEHLLKAADNALYRAKEEGRDRAVSA